MRARVTAAASRACCTGSVTPAPGAIRVNACGLSGRARTRSDVTPACFETGAGTPPGDGHRPAPGGHARLPVLAMVLDVARAGSDQEHVGVLAAAARADA